MQYFELMMGSMIMNNFSNFKTGFYIIDIFIIFIFFLFNYICKDQNLYNLLKGKVNNYFSPCQEKNKITFSFKRGEQSSRCKSLFHYLTHNNSVSTNINTLVEDVFKKFDWREDSSIETSNLYRVEQNESFKFTETIFGRVYTEEKENSEQNGKVTYKEVYYLVIFSKIEPLEKIRQFIEDCKNSYDKYLKDKILSEQYLITVEHTNTIDEDKDLNLNIKKEKWSSNVSFDSRFFPNKEKIINSIDYFLNNPEWYKNKGLNHTLGILLSGKPGCGKTSFIKALMNHTGRHCIEIKLNDSFDFSALRDIIYSEEITDEIIIPQNKRIIVFEDIDAMGSVVKDRDLKQKENEEAELKLKDEMLKLLSEAKDSEKSDIVTIKNKINKLDNNNLSYLLNILDGINETPGRIIIMTTNKPELLDVALKRPGRVDININFDNCNIENLKEILMHYWSNEDRKNYLKIKEMLNNEKFIKSDGVFSPAEIIDFCRQNSSLKETINIIRKLTD